MKKILTLILFSLCLTAANAQTVKIDSAKQVQFKRSVTTMQTQSYSINQLNAQIANYKKQLTATQANIDSCMARKRRVIAAQKGGK